MVMPALIPFGVSAAFPSRDAPPPPVIPADEDAEGAAEEARVDISLEADGELPEFDVIAACEAVEAVAGTVPEAIA